MNPMSATNSMNTTGPLDLRCYLVTSGTGQRTVDVAAEAAAAKAGVVQVRAKDATARELLELTVAVADAVQQANPTTRVLVDDRTDVAAAARLAGAAVHGVHLGQTDLPVTAARQILGADAVIGLTTGTPELVAAANEHAEVIDYIGAGPFRPTPTKDSGRDPLGVEGYPQLVALTELPVVAIGGITPHDVPALAATGIAGVAIVRSIMDAEHPGSVVQDVLTAFQAHRPWT